VRALRAVCRREYDQKATAENLLRVMDQRTIEHYFAFTDHQPYRLTPTPPHHDRESCCDASSVQMTSVEDISILRLIRKWIHWPQITAALLAGSARILLG